MDTSMHVTMYIHVVLGKNFAMLWEIIIVH